MDWVSLSVGLSVGLLWGIAVGRWQETIKRYDPVKKLTEDVVKMLKNGEDVHCSLVIGRGIEEPEIEGDLDDILPDGQNWRGQ